MGYFVHDQPVEVVAQTSGAFVACALPCARNKLSSRAVSPTDATPYPGQRPHRTNFRNSNSNAYGQDQFVAANIAFCY
jgi:hypothetical protein